MCNQCALTRDRRTSVGSTQVCLVWHWPWRHPWPGRAARTAGERPDTRAGRSAAPRRLPHRCGRGLRGGPRRRPPAPTRYAAGAGQPHLACQAGRGLPLGHAAQAQPQRGQGKRPGWRGRSSPIMDTRSPSHAGMGKAIIRPYDHRMHGSYMSRKLLIINDEMNNLFATGWVITWHAPNLAKSQEVLAMFGRSRGVATHPPMFADTRQRLLGNRGQSSGLHSQ